MSSFVKLQNIFKVIIKEIVKAPLHQLSKLHLRYGESVLAAVLAIQSRSPHFSARTLRRGTVCYGAHRGPKRFRSAHARLELSNGLNLSSYIISVCVCVCVCVCVRESEMEVTAASGCRCDSTGGHQTDGSDHHLNMSCHL